MDPLNECLCHLTRRQFLKRSGTHLGSIALGTLLAESLARAAPVDPANPLAPRSPHFPGRARQIIYLHMVGAPSQLDLFDYKPTLEKFDEQLCPVEFIEGKRFAFIRGHPKIAASKYRFARHGANGHEISELLPHLSKVADDISI